ncbi:transcriptional regulator [Streptococcus uberis]|uniref:M protein trans-acting positive regulator PRD domain-containing protein n=1 Tax=Streptococcus uberis TaxID=1349 RepID=UPI000C2D0C51|nr:M protein trans-acting positive regulator PRD domain-containing protein [Streptococcus uberis]AUC24283.1 transcriptional regulator [Streptococcus uberis]
MYIKQNLFSNQQLRGLKLAVLLNHGEEPCDYTHICRHLHCSFLTLQTEIAHLASFGEVRALPYVEPHLEVQYRPEFGPQKLFQSILNETPSMRLVEALFYRDFDSLEELAEALFTSLSTLKRLIKRTNVYLQLGFNCVINVRSVRIVGPEHSVRLLYLKYFTEVYDYYAWPFLDSINEIALTSLVDVTTSKFSHRVTHSLFAYLKIMSAVNLIRFSKGYRVNEVYPRSYSLYEKLKEDPTFLHLSELFWRDFGKPLDQVALSEMFSTYFRQDLILNAELDRQNTDKEVEGVTYEDMLETLEGIENRFGMVIANKSEISLLIYNALILKEHDIYENFLVYDYREPYIAYFKDSYPKLLEAFQEALSAPFKAKGVELAKERQNHLLYILLVNWDNLFFHISRAIDKQKVLVVEKGTCNSGQFLIAYAGQYFDIAIHEHHQIDMHKIKEEYDVVLTDQTLEVVDGVDIIYFSQLVPSIALEKLNKFLKKKIQKHFLEEPKEE